MQGENGSKLEMITYLYIDGFKAFREFEIYLTPLTVVAGTNASGKSNLFDALHFLSSLSQGKSLSEVMNGKRGEGDELFTQFHDGTRATEMTFKADLLLNRHFRDEFKQEGVLGVTRLRYELTISRREEKIGEWRFAITNEVLRPILLKDDVWLASLPTKVQGKLRPVQPKQQRKSFIETKQSDGRLIAEILLEYNEKASKKQKSPEIRKTINFDDAQRTLLSRYQDIDYLHIIAARQEITRWMFMHLSPEVMRTPSNKTDRSSWIMPNGGNLASAVNALRLEDDYLIRVLERRINQLLPNFIGVDVADDKENNQLILRLKDVNGRWYSSRVLSEGTLRIITLCVMLIDGKHRGVLCFEEPENGVHPQRINDIARVLSELSSNLSDSDTLQQIIVNTHSPLFIQSISKITDKWTSVYLSRMVASAITVSDGRRVKLYKTKMIPAETINGTEVKEYSVQDKRMTSREMADYLLTAQNYEESVLIKEE